MHRIGKGPFGRGLALAHDVVHAGVGRDLIVDGDIAAAHAAGVSGSVDIGSGASRVHNTKPSERGAPDATPRLNGLPAPQLCARAERSSAGAAIDA